MLMGRRKKGKKVLAGGSFNIVHQGHVFFLNRAKELGNTLVVVIASDRTVIKNKKHLLLPAEKRKKVVEMLGIADKVIIGSDSDFFRVVEKERPDIISLGHDQKLPKGLARRIREKFPECRILRIRSKLRGYSTSGILKQLGIGDDKNKNGGKD